MSFGGRSGGPLVSLPTLPDWSGLGPPRTSFSRPGAVPSEPERPVSGKRQRPPGPLSAISSPRFHVRPKVFPPPLGAGQTRSHAASFP